MLWADGVAYLTRPESSTIRMTSEVSWTRVRKYASLLRRITSRLSSTRSTTRAACRASTSKVPAGPGHGEHPDERLTGRPVLQVQGAEQDVPLVPVRAAHQARTGPRQLRQPA